MFHLDFQGRVLPFGSQAAAKFAERAANLRQAGRPISPLDAQRAAITQAAGARLATRNISDFVDCGVDLVNPWE